MWRSEHTVVYEAFGRVELVLEKGDTLAGSLEVAGARDGREACRAVLREDIHQVLQLAQTKPDAGDGGLE